MIPKDWFKILFFVLTSFFWALFYKIQSGSILMLSVFMTLLSLWMIMDKIKNA